MTIGEFIELLRKFEGFRMVEFFMSTPKLTESGVVVVLKPTNVLTSIKKEVEWLEEKCNHVKENLLEISFSTGTYSNFRILKNDNLIYFIPCK